VFSYVVVEDAHDKTTRVAGGTSFAALSALAGALGVYILGAPPKTRVLYPKPQN